MVEMGFGFEDIKADPTFFAALIVAVIGIIIAAYGHFAKKTKWITFAGLGVMVAALLVAGIAYFRRKVPENGNGNGNGTAGRRPPAGSLTGTATSGTPPF